MSRSRFAIALIGVGIVMILIGVVDAAGSGADAAPPVAAATSTTAIVSSTDVSEPATTAPEAAPTTTTSTVVMTTITLAPLVTASSSTTTSSTTSSTTSTTAPDPRSETVEEFVAAFAAAIAASDVDFLFERLHPAVVGGFGPALCRSWIEGEILLLGDYKLAGPVEGPRDQTFTTPAGTGTIADAFSAPVSFVFQGQSFDGEGGFALVDGTMMWLGQCR